MRYILFFFSIISLAQTQKFIPLDNDTLEFIEEVNYTLYSNNKPVYKNQTSNDTINILPSNISFDSISFNKLNYKETGLRKEQIKEIVLLSKIVYELNEVVVVGSSKKEIILGEENRFIRSRNRNFLDNNNYGIIFKEFELKNMQINKLVFYVEKVKYKTTYKIKFYSVTESGNPIIRQTLTLNEIVFESPVLILEEGTKNKVEIDLKNYFLDLADKNIFVTIELQAYYDKNNDKILPETKDKTKLKFQLSKKTNYYSKTSDAITNELSPELININVMINYDFAFKFFEKPHKSNLIAPAILLVTIPKN